jgi:hypothetical protein
MSQNQTPWDAAFHQRNPLYHTWKTMLRRCADPRDRNWNIYGGRPGNPVTVCERWKQSREAFVADMGPRPSPQHSLDRIDGTKGYFPENCRWASPKEQARNTSRNRRITYKGETRTLAEWAELNGIRYMALFYRLARGWSLDRAFTTPVDESPKKRARNRSSNHLLTYNGETLTATEWGERYGMGVHQLIQRLNQGWTVERALTTPIRRYGRQP